MKKGFFIAMLFMIPLVCACAHTPSRQVLFVLEPSLKLSSCSREIHLALVPLDASPPFDSSLMAYSQHRLEIEFYAYHRWAGPIKELVTEALTKVLQKWSCVILVPPSFHGAYVLRGRILRFVHRFEKDSSWGEVSVDFSLWSGNNPIAEKIFTCKVKALSDTPKGGAQALNKALEEVFARLTAWMKKEWKSTAQR
jgi:ABC-type uncharacterized transport system auxiliary subunit